MSTPESFVLNRHRSTKPSSGSGGSPQVREFHRGLPQYEVTPLVALPELAGELGLGAVLVKDESSRLGLPAFKMLGASWAIHRALAHRPDSAPEPWLITATDGNHGRAVARMARLLGLSARVVVPQGVSDRAISLIREEGATVEVLDAAYDDTVRYAASLAQADPEALLVQDTSWPGYEEVPQWIVDGYATLFEEAAEQSTGLGLDIDLLVVPAGVGSLAHAAVRFARSRAHCRVVTVEPTVAACIAASLAAGALTTVDTGQTAMAGLNCGTPAYLAWPDLYGDLAGAAVVEEEAVTRAMARLSAAGIDSGPCGAASLAALDILAADPARTDLGLGDRSTVLLLNTEGRRSAR